MLGAEPLPEAVFEVGIRKKGRRGCMGDESRGCGRSGEASLTTDIFTDIRE